MRKKPTYGELEQKVKRLESQAAEGKIWRDKVERLNAGLQTLRDINLLNASEKSLEEILKAACGNLVGNLGCQNAWVVLSDESGKILMVVGSGLEKDFSAMVTRLERGELTHCAQTALRESGVVVTEEPRSYCGACRSSEICDGKGVMTVRLEQAGKMYGLLYSTVPKDFVSHEEVRLLFEFIARDISFVIHRTQAAKEYEEAARALRESEEKYRSLVESTEDCIYLVDRSCRYLFMNEKDLARFGLPIEKVVGRTYGEFHSKEDTKTFERQVEEVFESGRSRWYDYRSERDSRNFIRTLSPVREAGGRTVSVTVVSKDISERKQMEQELKKSEERYRMIFEHSPLGIIHFDQDGTIVDCNEKFIELVGSSRRKLIGFNMLKSLRDQKMREALLDALSGNTGYYEGDYLSVTGGKVTAMRATYNEITSGEGGFLGGVAIYEDITARKRSEKALRESEEQLRSLSSKLITAQENERKRIAQELHDGIGQTLSAIKFGLEDVLQQIRERVKAPSSKTLVALVPVVQNAVEEVRRICMALRPAILDDLGILATISWFCREFQTIYSGVRIENQIDVQEDDVPDLLKVVLYRVIQETLNNIAKHSGADLVHINLREIDQTLELTVKDNGRGFDLEGANRRESFKRGLGLASMKERIETLGGAFSINSAKGTGTIIFASWPCK